MNTSGAEMVMIFLIACFLMVFLTILFIHIGCLKEDRKMKKYFRDNFDNF